MKHPDMEALRTRLEPFGEETVSIYLPRPVLEAGGEKWRIARKNAIDAIAELAPSAARARDYLQSLELAAFKGRGVAIFEADGAFATAFLSHRPRAMIASGTRPLVLPLLADVAGRGSAWVLAVDRSEPVLYQASGDDLERRDDIFDAPKYEATEAQREVQDDIFFHSSNRGGSRGAGTGVGMHHALGTAAGKEREKTDEAYYREVVDALVAALPYQVREVTIVGDPGVVGELARLLAPTGLVVHSIHGAGEALGEDRIAGAMRERWSGEQNDAELGDGLTDPIGIRGAAERGQIAMVWVDRNLCGLEQSGARSEHLELQDATRDERLVQANELVLKAIAQGADADVADDEKLSATGVLAALRW